MLKRQTSIILSCIATIQMTTVALNGSENHETTKNEYVAPFSPFAGKITRNKVRMRLKPSLDSVVLRELEKDNLLVIVSEDEDFYGIQAPTDIKAYVYRTFILDNVVEGNHVNVRLEPNVDAPVIMQLNAGETITGNISPLHSKWLEISIPKSTPFFVAKDFVEKIGEPSLVETITKRRENANLLLESTYQVAQVELQKPYQQIKMDGIFQNLNKIIADKNNLPEQIERAKAMLTTIQDKYLHKKIAFLEEKPAVIAKFETQSTQTFETPVTPLRNPITDKMNCWLLNEDSIFQNWSIENNNQSKEEFYSSQKKEAVTIRGLVEAYDRTVKNKPGDYVLINEKNQLPIAYLYSTVVNLQDFLGQEIALDAIQRPNNSFAFPAYFVIGIDK